MQYMPRVVETELQSRLASAGAVVIEGPRACGKTATARRVAQSEVLLDVDDNARRVVEIDPALVLEGASPRLIDEWQLAPGIWNHVRRAVDDRGEPGQFILTGSAAPADDITRHTGAGRIARVRMRPLSLFESGVSTGSVSLSELIAGGVARAADTGLTLQDVAEQIVGGGWPGTLRRDARARQQGVRDYLEEVRRADLGVVSHRGRDPRRIDRLLRSLARHTATEASIATLCADTGADADPLARDTVSSYLDVLGALMVVEDQPAWAPHLRSRARIRGAPKRHFVDPSLAAAALRADAGRLLADLELLGHLFESLVVRDLRIHAQACDATVLHYRDSNGQEVDAIVECGDGRWAAFEVKLGQGQIDAAANGLIRFAAQVYTSRCGSPACLGVIVPAGLAYRRPDGVSVIPIAALGP